MFQRKKASSETSTAFFCFSSAYPGTDLQHNKDRERIAWQKIGEEKGKSLVNHMDKIKRGSLFPLLHTCLIKSRMNKLQTETAMLQYHTGYI